MMATPVQPNQTGAPLSRRAQSAPTLYDFAAAKAVYAFTVRLDPPFSAPMPVSALNYAFRGQLEVIEPSLAHLEQLGYIERPEGVLGARDVALTLRGCAWVLTEGATS